MKLIINADDLGYSPVINQAIFNLHTQGRLTSTSLLVNMPYSQDAIDGLQTHPGLGVGVHLNLTKGRPLSPPGKIPTLVNPKRDFWATQHFYARAVLGQINISEVRVELRAQIEYAMEFGIHPAHLDSHSHWHLLPYLRKCIVQLAKEYQIPGIRQSALRRTLIPSRLWLGLAAREHDSQPEFYIPDYLCSLHQWMRTDRQPVNLFFSQDLSRLIAQPHITLELVIHPGKVHDPDFPADTLRPHQRQWEYDFLRDARFDAWLTMIDAEISCHKAL